MIETGTLCGKCGARLRVRLDSKVRNMDPVLRLVLCAKCEEAEGRPPLRGVLVAADNRWPWFFRPEERRG